MVLVKVVPVVITFTDGRGNFHTDCKLFLGASVTSE
jgi:hypothetical protein